MKTKKRNSHESLQEKEDLISFVVRRQHAPRHRLIIKINILVSTMLLLSSCNFHMDASLEEISKKIPSLHLNEGAPREIIEGETVITPSGVIVKGSFGEIMEKKVLDNGVVFEGAVYE